MAMRQIISYDDITLPYESSTDHQASGRPPPAKKRKKHNQKTKRVNSPRQPSHVIETTTEESRELTHEEIWDDSALVGAWEAAQQEYESYHGPGDDWKNEPQKKSPLWYNVPVERTNGVPTIQPSTTVAQSDNIEPAEPDSQPLNFDTFLPTHDPSLYIPTVQLSNNALGTPTGEIVGQDEAFSRATTAMYWAGYWTAMYHCQRNLSDSNTGEKGVDEAEAEGETEEES